MLPEGFLHGNVADHIAAGIVVEQSVETDALDGGNERTCGCEGLQASAGADAYHRQRAVFLFLFAGVVVNIGQCVEFVDHDVDVVAANAVRLAGDALALVHAGNGVELAARHFVLDAVEVGGNGVDTGGIADENNLVSQEFRLQVEVET